jgi:hypothetical protein
MLVYAMKMAWKEPVLELQCTYFLSIRPEVLNNITKAKSPDCQSRSRDLTRGHTEYESGVRRSVRHL